MLGREIMKIKFKRFFISLILISLFIISLGFVSASNDSNGLSDMDSIDDEDILFVENFGLDEEISSVDINSQSDSLEDDDNELNDENTGYIVDSKLQSGSGNDFTDIQKLIDDADWCCFGWGIPDSDIGCKLSECGFGKYKIYQFMRAFRLSWCQWNHRKQLQL